jgi:hypothetical protein
MELRRLFKTVKKGEKGGSSYRVCKLESSRGGRENESSGLMNSMCEVLKVSGATVIRIPKHVYNQSGQ